jgi:hypothetical protein
MSKSQQPQSQRDRNKSLEELDAILGSLNKVTASLTTVAMVSLGFSNARMNDDHHRL